MPSDTEVDAVLQRLQLLEDRVALTELLNRYCQAADCDDFAGHADCFADDAVLISRMGEVRGRAAIMAQNRAYAVRYEILQHLMSNMAFQIDGDEATGTATARFVAMRSAESPAEQRAGRYEFRFRREDGRWWIVWERLDSYLLTSAS